MATVSCLKLTLRGTYSLYIFYVGDATRMYRIAGKFDGGKF